MISKSMKKSQTESDTGSIHICIYIDKLKKKYMVHGIKYRLGFDNFTDEAFQIKQI